MKHAKRILRQRRRRCWRVSNRVKRFSTRARLAVFRSHRHIYAQLIDDAAGKTLASASTLDPQLRQALKYGGNKEAAAAVGRAIAERALAAGITQAALDRRQYRYHGRVAALADAARDAGLDLGAKPPQPEAKPEPQPKKPGKRPSDTGGDKAGETKGEKKGATKAEKPAKKQPASAPAPNSES